MPGIPSVPETPSPVQPGVYFFHTDQVGAPQAVTAMDGSTVWQADWEPFGSVAIGQGKLTSNLRFPGQYFDEETGLHYNYYRHYDPETGRYIESDPIGLLGGLNTFAYVGGDPIANYDYYGLLLDPIVPWPAEALGSWASGSINCFLKAYSLMMDAYSDMQSASQVVHPGGEKGWAHQDWYFHCRANCEAAQLGPCGEDCAKDVSKYREWWDRGAKGDSKKDSLNDHLANDHGRRAGKANPNGDCRKLCSPFRPGSNFPGKW